MAEKHLPAGKLQELKLAELMDMFGDEATTRSLQAAYDRDDVTALVVFENLDFWSSQRGAGVVALVGPDKTYKTVEDAEDRWIGDAPSRRMYARYFTRKP